MIPPFANHPLVQQFNEIKKYFRQHETDDSRSRMREFRHYARVIDLAGVEVAFDFVGSINFGQATAGSDVDIVMYLRCENSHDECTLRECRPFLEVENLLLRTLVQAYARTPYEVQIIDCINLNLLEKELERGDPASSVLIRFAFYRSVCRLVNARLMRPYQRRLHRDKQLIEGMKPHVFAIFDSLSRNQQHNLSMRKYQERLKEGGVRLPASIQARILAHFELRDEMDGNWPPRSAS